MILSRRSDVCRFLTKFDQGQASLAEAVETLCDYEHVFKRSDWIIADAVYRRVLGDKPWKNCSCEICQRIGIHVMIFRQVRSEIDAEAFTTFMCSTSNSTLTWAAQASANRNVFEEEHIMDKDRQN